MKEYEAVFQNQPVDVSEEFAKQQNHFFIGSKVPEFDPDTSSGRGYSGRASPSSSASHTTSSHSSSKTTRCGGTHRWTNTRMSRHSPSRSPSSARRPCASGSPPGRGYTPTNPRSCSTGTHRPTSISSWEMIDAESLVTYENPSGSVTVVRDPVRLEFRDASRNLLTRCDPPRYRLDRGAPPLRFRVLRIPFQGSRADDLRPQR
jgi:alpha-D-xyloside xylohydrolase